MLPLYSETLRERGRLKRCGGGGGQEKDSKKEGGKTRGGEREGEGERIRGRGVKERGRGGDRGGRGQVGGLVLYPILGSRMD